MYVWSYKSNYSGIDSKHTYYPLSKKTSNDFDTLDNYLAYSKK